jgi:hypothetical protein
MHDFKAPVYGPVRRSKLDLMGIRFADAGGDGGGAGGDGDGKQERTFTQAEHQAELDRVVAERLARERDKYKDYDDLKAKAEGAKTIEDKLADLEKKHAEAEARALRSSIAAEFGISTKKGPKGEPSDADLFLTGSDEATMRTQAERFGAAAADRKKQGNVAPKEGDTKTEGKDDGELRTFARALFDRAD